MDGSDSTTQAGIPIDIRGSGKFSGVVYGKLSMAPNASAPLLVVFGGIDVKLNQSGDYSPTGTRTPSSIYMWNYMNNLKHRFHIFVAQDINLNGAAVYSSLTSTVQAKGLTPSQQILYLFSGGYKPGMQLLTGDVPKRFSSIYLVDIWMGPRHGSSVEQFYTDLATGNGARMTYVYTEHGATNDEARDDIVNNVQRTQLVAGQGAQVPKGTSAVFVKAQGMGVHMRTNTVAVTYL